MTLTELFQGRNYVIEKKESIDSEPWVIIKVIDKDIHKTILKYLRYSTSTPDVVYCLGKKQNIAKSIKLHLFEELDYMYKEQEREKARKKAEENAKKFEQKKNLVYQRLFDTIKTIKNKTE